MADNIRHTLVLMTRKAESLKLLVLSKMRMNMWIKIYSMLLLPAWFDADGVLWYVISSMRDNEDDYYKVPATLMRWDITRGGKPESLGIMGTPREQ